MWSRRIRRPKPNRRTRTPFWQKELKLRTRTFLSRITVLQWFLRFYPKFFGTELNWTPEPWLLSQHESKPLTRTFFLIFRWTEPPNPNLLFFSNIRIPERPRSMLGCLIRFRIYQIYAEIDIFTYTFFPGFTKIFSLVNFYVYMRNKMKTLNHHTLPSLMINCILQEKQLDWCMVKIEYKKYFIPNTNNATSVKICNLH